MPTKREWLNLAIFGIAIGLTLYGNHVQQLFYHMISVFFYAAAAIMYIYGLVAHKDDWMDRYK